MSANNMPEAEVDVTVELVQALLADQHPDLAALSIVEFANGWDNVIFRLGNELSVRLPRRSAAAELVDHEQAVLPGLAQRLPLAVPAPVRVGHPGLGYPWAWSVNPWLDGEIVAEADLADPAAEARRLGEFLGALHVAAPDDAPANPYRGHFIGDNDAVFLERVEQLRGVDVHGTPVDLSAIRRCWSALIDVAPWSGDPVWIHGDLHAANMLACNGQISAVIDWGDVCAGDPATDLSIAWSLFSPEDQDVLRAAWRDVDDSTWQRAQAWSMHFMVMYLTHSADNPTIGTLGERLYRRLIE
ncbi:MAG: aminoglycoside phosphotransferase family protein [Ilumatobacter sp.]